VLDVQIKGAEELESLAKRLKAAGDGDLRKELLAAIRKAARPLPAAVRASAMSQLPRSGGLAARVAGGRLMTRTRLSGGSVGVKFESRGIYNLRNINSGKIRHPVFGRPDSWVAQEVDAGWFSEPVDDAVPEVRDEIQRAMRDVADKITKSGARL
jgi:hypothetical protein